MVVFGELWRIQAVFWFVPMGVTKRLLEWYAVRNPHKASQAVAPRILLETDVAMKSRIALSAIVAAALGAGIGQAAPLTDVVFGNLGSTGESSLGATNTVIGSGSGQNWIGQAFTTGSTASLLSLQSVALGLSATSGGSVAATVGLYTGGTSAPGTLVATSAPTTVAGSAQATYEFLFSNFGLAANSTYWVIPNAGVNWFLLSEFPGTPGPQNGSDYAYANTRSSNSVAILPGSWSAAIPQYSISVQAVPEPSAYALAAAGLAVAGFIRARRRTSKV